VLGLGLEFRLALRAIGLRVELIWSSSFSVARRMDSGG